MALPHVALESLAVLLASRCRRALAIFPEPLLESRWAANLGGQTPAFKAPLLNTTATKFKLEGFTWA